MEELILLGQIPGTSLHITFGNWLVSAALLLVTAILYYDFRHNRNVMYGMFYMSIKLSKRRLLQTLDQIAL